MIHKYKIKEDYILMDINSGGIYQIDNIAYDMLDFLSAPMKEECPQEVKAKLLERYSEDEVYETYSELLNLYKNDMLFSNDNYEEYKSKMTVSPIKAMCLHVAHDCNLKCGYCFASTGDFGTNHRSIMSLETGKKAIDFLLKHSQGRRNLELDFFGGEPLMNFEVVKEVVKYARSKEAEYNKNFRFTITTNGVLLDDDKIDFINKEMVNVVLSLDGRKEVNDKMRPTMNDLGSYDVIMPKFKKLVERRNHQNYYMRGTFTKNNLDFSQDVLHIYNEGFKEISVEPVVTDESNSYAITKRDLPAVFDEYEKLAQIIIEHNREGKHFNFFHFMLDLEHSPCAIKRLRGCGCGNEYVAVTPEGDIYPCHQFVGKDEWKMGNLQEESFDMAIKENFSKATVYTKEECANCFAKFYCSGGCNANNVEYEGDILKPHSLSCELQKKRLECAIWIKCVEDNGGNDNE